MSTPDLTIPSLFTVKGKVAVVTGGGSGIGTMIATALVQNGAKVYIASRKESQLKEVSERLNKLVPGSCHYIVTNLGSKDGCDKLADAIKQNEQKIHILVNNSGASWGAPYDKFPEKEGWDRILALNVKSIFYLTQGLTDLLAKDSNNQDPGRVINISSVAAFNPIAEGSRVSAEGTDNTSKAAVNHLTSTLATTLARRYITVNAICPGVFPSKMTAYGLKKQGDKMAEGQPMGRLGAPSDMGGVALFLASPAASHITGAHIVLDGGAMITARARI
ncbi:rhamnolipids biosynthesis 3-oxoacyl-reductase [Hysterangium stoloniferum]|nr:rhamnolipids biosynthesis 3-oxoacyl-reductase [Hysterangium stoloniferum]